jgi:hypothetical protein
MSISSSFWVTIGFYVALIASLANFFITYKKERKFLTVALIPPVLAIFALLVNGLANMQTSRSNKLTIDSLRTTAKSSINRADSLKLKVDSLTHKSNMLQYKLDAANDKNEPRVITSEQERVFVNFLENKPIGNVFMSALISDEPSIFAGKIKKLLQEAGYNCEYITPIRSIIPIKGIVLQIANIKSAPPYLSPLQIAFMKMGFWAPVEIDKHLPTGTMSILVGSK